MLPSRDRRLELPKSFKAGKWLFTIGFFVHTQISQRFLVRDPDPPSQKGHCVELGKQNKSPSAL